MFLVKFIEESFRASSKHWWLMDLSKAQNLFVEKHNKLN